MSTGVNRPSQPASFRRLSDICGSISIFSQLREVGGWFRSDLFVQVEGRMKLNSKLNRSRRFDSEAGSAQSTHCRGWDQDLDHSFFVGWTEQSTHCRGWDS